MHLLIPDSDFGAIPGISAINLSSPKNQNTEPVLQSSFAFIPSDFPKHRDSETSPQTPNFDLAKDFDIPKDVFLGKVDKISEEIAALQEKYRDNDKNLLLSYRALCDDFEQWQAPSRSSTPEKPKLNVATATQNSQESKHSQSPARRKIPDKLSHFPIGAKLSPAKKSSKVEKKKLKGPSLEVLKEKLKSNHPGAEVQRQIPQRHIQKRESVGSKANSELGNARGYIPAFRRATIDPIYEEREQKKTPSKDDPLAEER